MNKTKLKSFLIITVMVIASALYLHYKNDKTVNGPIVNANNADKVSENCSEEVNQVVNEKQSVENTDQKQNISCLVVQNNK